MGISTFDAQQMLARLDRNRKREPEHTQEGAAEREVGKGGLVEDIRRYCDAQWPKWIFDSGRTDQRSTRPLGAHDATVFLPAGRVLCVELKAKDGKLSQDQQVWRALMRHLGHEVHVCRSLGEFQRLANEAMSAPVGPQLEQTDCPACHEETKPGHICPGNGVTP